MKFCPNCGAKLEEGAAACPSCGEPLPVVIPVAAADPTDHTAEFTPEDISENKVMAMLPYLLGIVGVIIAMLAHTESKYTGFHVRQYLKISVCQALVSLASTVLCWTLIVPAAGAIALLILFVIRIVCFFQICRGRAKEPAIVHRFGFLK